MQMNDIQKGDTIVADTGFTCLPAGEHIVERDGYGNLFVRCSDGLHLLDGQIGRGDHLVGFSRPKQTQ